jgi:hypothetical protein
MKAELVKRQDRWDLYGEDGSKIASSAPNPIGKLSIKNCEAIENGYDLDELAGEYANKELNEELTSKSGNFYGFSSSFKEGFQKALSILGDKKFSEDDMKNGIEYGIQSVLQAVPGVTSAQSVLDSYKQSLQQTEWEEWEVEIVTELAYCKKGEPGCKVYDQTKNSKDVFNLIYHCDGQIEGRFIHREPTGLKPTCVGYSKPMLDKDDCLILKRI